MLFIRYQKYFLAIPVLLSVLAVAALFVWGLKPGIDLVGGSLLQVAYNEDRPSAEEVHTVLEPLALGEVRVQPTKETEYILRQRELSNDEKGDVLEALGTLGEVKEVQFNSVGPSIGSELLEKAWWAIALVALGIIAFIAFAFRHVSKPVSSWKYGVVIITTLLHDILIPAGLFAYLGFAHGAEVDSLFIVALLTILGISVNDTIVVFDRVRENLKINIDKNLKESFSDVIGRSIMQTLTRSFNTSLTVIIMLATLYFIGPDPTKNFALTLMVGMIAGTYSSICLAAPLLVLIERFQNRNEVEKT